ncbi:MAG: hypothetical protein WED04_04740 [Promethearchaeati archaeon SRVP18_Atabeyarchaeia-1]
MTRNQEDETLRVLTSVKKSMEGMNRNLSKSLRILEEAIIRISALGESHIKLIMTLMDILGVPEDQRPPLDFPSSPTEELLFAERSEVLASGILRTVIKSLRSTSIEISKALTSAKEEINKRIGNFDTYEMEILARMLTKDPERYLDLDEQVAYREKIRKWHRQLKEAFEKL